MKTSFPADALADSAALFGKPRIFRQSCRLGPMRKSVAGHKFLTVLDREALCRKLEARSRV